jgi:hypothetical protein
LAAWWLLGIDRRVLWPAAVVALAVAPVALAAQGLPSSPVVGAGFGTQHQAANLLVQIAVLLAAFAGLTELARMLPPARRARESSLEPE